MIDPRSRLVTIESVKRLHVPESRKLFVREEKKILAFKAEQGLPGVPGDGSTWTTPETDISYGDVLYVRGNQVVKASCDDPYLIANPVFSFFVAQGETTPTTTTIFCRRSGTITFSSPVLEPSVVYYLGTNGSLTKTPVTTGIMLVIGTALTELDFFVDIQAPILLR